MLSITLLWVMPAGQKVAVTVAMAGGDQVDCDGDGYPDDVRGGGGDSVCGGGGHDGGHGNRLHAKEGGNNTGCNGDEGGCLGVAIAIASLSLQ